MATRRERLKSALYLRLKKRKTFFWKLEMFENFFVEKCRISAEKCKRGILLDLLTCILLQNIKKLGGGLLETLKNFRKKVHSAEKNRKGDPLVSSGFVGYVKKSKK